MARFNVKSKGTKTENYAGGEAFSESPELELVSVLLTSFVQDQYYRGANEGIERTKELVRLNDKKFCAKTAIYARTKFGMRSISHVVAGELAKHVKGEEWSKRFFDKVVYRPDDMMEILSYYLNEYKKPIPNALKKGLALAFNKFDEYSLAKYRGNGKALSLIDVVNLVHPKPTDKNKIALGKLVEDKLVSKGTWESELTKAGQEADGEEAKNELKKEVWVKLIKEKKLGYFALLRNLRNILEQAPEAIPDAIKMLTNGKLIKKSLVLPFRFTTALEQIKQTNFSESMNVIIALNMAVDISLDNVPKLDGKTLVVLDVSGSMEGKPSEIGSLFAAILVKTNFADFMKFSNDAKYVTLNPLDSTITLADSIKFATGGTNFHSIFKKANKPYDRIIILSDMQGWMEYHAPTAEFNDYKSRTNCDPFIYSFDLQGYGSLQFPERNVFCLAGFSEKIFDVMKYLEQDKKALIKEIEKVEI